MKEIAARTNCPLTILGRTGGADLSITAEGEEVVRLSIAELEAAYIAETLASTRGNKSEAARLLGISRKNLYEKLARQKTEAGGQRSEVSKKQN